MSIKEIIVKNFKKKIKILKKHNDLYFNYDKPRISDSEYDKLKNEQKIVINIFLEAF